MNIRESLLKIYELMELSKERKWNIQFQLPSFGSIPEIMHNPIIRWNFGKYYFRGRRTEEP